MTLLITVFAAIKKLQYYYSNKIKIVNILKICDTISWGNVCIQIQIPRPHPNILGNLRCIVNIFNYLNSYNSYIR